MRSNPYLLIFGDIEFNLLDFRSHTSNAPPLVFKPSITVVGSNTGHLDIKAPEENTPTPMAANEPNMNIVFKEPAQMGGSVPIVVSEEKPTIENPTNIKNDIVVKKLS